jgi:ribonuclease VapC
VSEIILDASALLALLHREKGHDQIESLLLARPCLICTVNLSEVIARLVDHGMSFPDACVAVSLPNLQCVDFDLALAQIAGSLRLETRKMGLSLGDRSCLALAHASIAADVYTSDAIWKRLSFPKITVHVIR